MSFRLRALGRGTGGIDEQSDGIVWWGASRSACGHFPTPLDDATA